MNLQLDRKFLLAEPRGNPQQAEDAGIGRCQVKNLQSFSKLRSGVRTQLGEEKRRFSSIRFLASHLENNYCTKYSFMLQMILL